MTAKLRTYSKLSLILTNFLNDLMFKIKDCKKQKIKKYRLKKYTVTNLVSFN